METKELKCDFCMSTDIVCSFDGPETVVMMAGEGRTATWQQSGGWASCEACAQLMEAGKLEDLAERAIDAPGNGMAPQSADERAAFKFLLLGQYKNINQKREGA